jgi:hypothetical protein
VVQSTDSLGWHKVDNWIVIYAVGLFLITEKIIISGPEFLFFHQFDGFFINDGFNA